MAPILVPLSNLSLGGQVIVLRWISALLSACIIPLVYGVCSELFENMDIGIACAAIVAVMPEFAIDTVRVANDCLAVLIFTILTWVGLRIAGSGITWHRAGCLGLALGAGLLTKAYFLTAVPAVVLLLANEMRRNWKKWPMVLSTLGSVAVIAGWWYVRNLIITGTLSGLSEAKMLRGDSLGMVLGKATTVPWITAIDSILLSHIYFGAWSSLTVRSWIYHSFYA